MTAKALSAEQPTFVRYQVLAVACSLAILTYVQRQGFIAATPYIKQDLHLDDHQIGYFLAVWLMAYGLTASSPSSAITIVRAPRARTSWILEMILS